MAYLGKEAVKIPTYCEWCYGVGTSRCGRCHAVNYCSREHQVLHWKVHKEVCKKSDHPPLPAVSSQTAVNLPSSSRYGEWYPDNAQSADKDVTSSMTIQSNYNPNTRNDNSGKNLEYFMLGEEEIFSALSSELLSSDSNFWDLINTCDTQSISDYGMSIERNQSSQITGSEAQNFTPYTPASQPQSPATSEDLSIMQKASLTDICANVIHDMNRFGICVLDKFVGASYANLILQEVKDLYKSGIFKKGELGNPNPYRSNESIRSDLTTWVTGSEPNCKHIGSLMKRLDLILGTCNKMPKNGILSKYKIHRRTKAMVACYPGDGTHYKKHIDNSQKDGRCITCVYYLNQNWEESHGGLLRIFPTNNQTNHGSIQPLFDRMLFFWSDKRNPHEVLPSFATRFAITVWYFDSDERDQALKSYREKAHMK